MRYLIEVLQSTTIPITVDADSQQNAIERALNNEGETGDSEPRDTIVMTVRCLD